ncbi:MAG: TerC family protein [Alphaproteobacteria bacterium]|nr:TerC family protein [Alphaproteobacteria bacterium]
MYAQYTPWILFNLFVIAVLVIDLGFFNKKSHVVGRKEALAWSLLWISLALIFCVGVYFTEGRKLALEFLAGYVIEKSLSLDNLFVIILIFKMHKISPKHQHRVLFWGILGALVMRSAMIVAGIKLIENFEWLLYIFGLFLVYAGVSTLFDKLPPGEEAPENPFIRWLNKKLPVKKEDYGQAFIVRENGKLFATPLLMALLFIEFADLLFAIDSIPAVLAISRDPFIVYTSNIFAILGLRSLYFLIADIIPRFYYIHHALAFILVFVGTKLLLIDLYHIPIGISLSTILIAFSLAVIASIIRNKRIKKL